LDPETDEFSLQQEKSLVTEIIEPRLNLNLIINGSAQNQPINFFCPLKNFRQLKTLGSLPKSGL